MSTVGVIGTGSFGQKRIQALIDSPHVQDIFIFDISKKSLLDTAQKFSSLKIHVGESLETILDNPDVEAIFICTPNSTHAEYAERAIMQRKHVLCEKPLTLEPRIMRKLLRLAKKYDVYINVGTNHRYFPSVQTAINRVKAGAIGDVVSMHASIGTNGERIQNSWFWKKELSLGGTMIDNGHHLLDLAHHFCGPFERCIGQTSKRKWQLSEVEDYAVAIFSTASSEKSPGTEAILRSSWRQPAGYMSIELWGTQGMLYVEMSDRETLTVQKNGKVETLDFTDSPKTALQQEVEVFLKECNDRHQYWQNTAEHLMVLTEMIHAFYTSDQQGRRVRL